MSDKRYRLIVKNSTVCGPYYWQIWHGDDELIARGVRSYQRRGDALRYGTEFVKKVMRDGVFIGNEGRPR